MVSGGLGWTDHGRREVIGGYSLEFFERVGKKYGRPIEWRFEPHVAEEVFRELAKEAGVAVHYRHRLREKNGVSKRGAHITAIVMENGARFAGRVFADATIYLLLFITLSGVYLWWAIKAERRTGLALISAGAITLFGLIFAVLHG